LGTLRSVTAELHGSAAAQWWRRCAASNPFPPPPFQLWVRRAAAEDGAGFPSPSRVRPGRRQAGAKGEFRCVVTSAVRAGSPSDSSVHAFGASVRFISVSWLSTTLRTFALLQSGRVRQSGTPGIFGAGIRRGAQHFDVRSEERCIREIVGVAVRK
jgi:hypothetical protein